MVYFNVSLSRAERTRGSLRVFYSLILRFYRRRLIRHFLPVHLTIIDDSSKRSIFARAMATRARLFTPPGRYSVFR